MTIPNRDANDVDHEPNYEHPKPHPDPDWLRHAAEKVRAESAAQAARHPEKVRHSHPQPRRRR